MANILDTSQATATIVQPVKAETLNFLQNASKGTVNNVLLSLIGGVIPGTGLAYVIAGCVYSVVSTTYSITAGVIWYNGEVFNVPATSGTVPSGGNIMIMVLNTAQDTTNADPVTFSDQIQRNVHNIRTINITTGTNVTTGFILGYAAVSGAVSGGIIGYVSLNVVSLLQALQTETNRATAAEVTLQNKISYMNNVWATVPLTSGNVAKTGVGAISAISGDVFYNNNIGNTTIGNFILNITNGSGNTALTITLPVTWANTTMELSFEIINLNTLVNTKTIATNTMVLTLSTGGDLPTGAIQIIGSFSGQTTT